LTPWVEHGGCQCSSALIIEKSQIKSVTKTEHRHFCCGKSLIVVEVNFAENASIPLSDVFAQASQAAESGHHEHGHHHDTPGQGMLGHPGTAYQVPQAPFGGVYPAVGGVFALGLARLLSIDTGRLASLGRLRGFLVAIVRTA
jgi:hypothetical protein